MMITNTDREDSDSSAHWLFDGNTANFTPYYGLKPGLPQDFCCSTGMLPQSTKCPPWTTLKCIRNIWEFTIYDLAKPADVPQWWFSPVCKTTLERSIPLGCSCQNSNHFTIVKYALNWPVTISFHVLSIFLSLYYLRSLHVSSLKCPFCLPDSHLIYAQ